VGWDLFFLYGMDKEVGTRKVGTGKVWQGKKCDGCAYMQQQRYTEPRALWCRAAAVAQFTQAGRQAGRQAGSMLAWR
jgi:hypothetical protein